MTEHTLNAEGKKLGRLASEAAVLLIGKDKVDYARNKVPDSKVLVTNASKLNITEKKLTSVKYKSFSGYPGGLKQTPMNRMIEKKGYAEIIKLTIHGMLPANKLRSELMKKLIVTE